MAKTYDDKITVQYLFTVRSNQNNNAVLTKVFKKTVVNRI